METKNTVLHENCSLLKEKVTLLEEKIKHNKCKDNIPLLSADANDQGQAKATGPAPLFSSVAGSNRSNRSSTRSGDMSKPKHNPTSSQNQNTTTKTNQIRPEQVKVAIHEAQSAAKRHTRIHKLTQINGTQVLADREGKYIKRDASFFKIFNPSIPSQVLKHPSNTPKRNAFTLPSIPIIPRKTVFWKISSKEEQATILEASSVTPPTSEDPDMHEPQEVLSDDDISFSSAPEAPTTDTDNISVSDSTECDNFKKDILSNPDIQEFQAVEPSDTHVSLNR
ncbi:unnamed protein product [Ceutorhynchus assimilis]|uniref:Uncharacterized protein n=1 Tax=Ceutorhynchus assimilis TaxID=467358 RepID=A0A9N9MLG5_9CUCU|nr:unnamed protein product [Ceutorhynchus assimilis]